MKKGTPSGITPDLLVQGLFEDALAQAGEDMKEAAVQVMRFLTESLVLAANISSGGDESARKGMLKYLAEQIEAAPPHPLIAAGAKKDRS
jgi:hypothetical protein